MELIKNKDFIYRVKKGDSLQKISNKFNVMESKIIKDNNLTDKNIEEGDVLYIEEENSFTYIVKPLDTLVKIANKYNISVDYIIKKNQLENDKIFIGQILVF